jgi:hypothetical protein
MTRGPAAIAAVLAIGACGGDGDATAEPLPGAPAAVRALLATGDGVIVIGGTSAFGLHRLQRYRDGAWTVAVGVAPFGARATLLAGDTVYAASDTALYRLDDAADLRWSDARAIPPPVPGLIGAHGDTILGAAPDDGGGALLAWQPGARVWRELARPLGEGPRGFLVGDGHVTWSDPARGVLRAEAGTISVIADCGDCIVPVIPVTDDTFVTCGTSTPPAESFRIGGAGVSLPDDLAPCIAASGGAGHGLLVTEDAVLELPPGASSWKRVTAAVTGLTYVHAGGAIYAYGDGISARGVYVLDL